MSKNYDPTMYANNLTPAYPTHPGEVLKEEIEYRGLDKEHFAEQIGIPYITLNDILECRIPLSTENAYIIATALDVNAKTLIGLQTEYNMLTLQRDKSFIKRLDEIRKLVASVAL